MHRPIRRYVFILLAPIVLLVIPGGDVTADMPETFQNLQVLPKDISKDELKNIMRGFTAQLDVKCSFCHILDEYHKDDNKHKHIARDMIRLVQHLRDNPDNWFPKHKEEDEEKPELLTCWMCHRGSAEVESFTPDEEDDW